MTQRGYMTKEIDKYSIDNTDYTVGQDNVQKWGFDVHNPVFGISAGLIAAFLLLTVLVDAHQAKIGLDTVKQNIIAGFDWLFIWSGNLFLLFCIGLVISPFGKNSVRWTGRESGSLFSILVSDVVCCRDGDWFDVLECRRTRGLLYGLV